MLQKTPRIDPVSDDRFAMFDAGDKQFLTAFFEKHPLVEDNFARYLAQPPVTRPAMAHREQATLDRKGWARRDIPDPENVRAHSHKAARMLKDFLDDTGNQARAMKLEQMMRVHDIPEVIVGDFTPHDPISNEDKHRVEWLAARVIYEAPQFELALQRIKEYIDQETADSHLAHDFDKGQAVVQAAIYQHLHPDKEGLYEEFYGYSVKRMKTPEGKDYLEEFHANKDARVQDWLANQGKEIQR